MTILCERTFALLTLALYHLSERLGELLTGGRDTLPVLEAWCIMHSFGREQIA